MWHDPDRNILIYETQDKRVLQYANNAVALNGAYVAMPATLLNLQIMRVLGFPVIRPLASYDWPRSPLIKAPFHAQTETANFLAVNPRASVLSDMGTGKTLSALWGADALMRDQLGLKALIVAPLSTLQSVWADTIFAHFLGRRKYIICHGDRRKRLEALNNRDVDFYITNHDGLKSGAVKGRGGRIVLTGFAQALEARKDIRLAIVDEIGGFRDSTSLRSRAAKLILSPREYLWGMTGTPMPNGPRDAYGIAKLLNNVKGESFTNFRQRVEFQLSKFKWVPRQGGYEEALKLLEPAIRFNIEDCQDLPELNYQARDVELSQEQRERLREIKAELLLLMKDGSEVTVANEAALRTKMLQIASGIVYGEGHREHVLDMRPRLRALEEIIEDESAKTIVFCPFVSVANHLNKALKNFSRELIIGATPVKDRTRIIRAFQQERAPRVLVAHPETIAEGQTLTAAATTVWWGPIDKTNTYIQANKRMHRPGQTRNCTVVNLSGSSLEKECFRRLANNESMQGLMLQLVEMGI